MLCTPEHLGQIGPINQAQTSIFGLLLLLIYGLQKKKEKIKEGEENRTEAVRTDRNLKRSRMQDQSSGRVQSRKAPSTTALGPVDEKDLKDQSDSGLGSGEPRVLTAFRVNVFLLLNRYPCAIKPPRELHSSVTHVPFPNRSSRKWSESGHIQAPFASRGRVDRPPSPGPANQRVSGTKISRYFEFQQSQFGRHADTDPRLEAADISPSSPSANAPENTAHCLF